MSRVRISSPAPNMAPWPSGKAKLCKSFTPQFKSGWCLQSKSSCITQEFFICRCGGIGRRKGLKIPRGQPRTGSSPVTGTKRNLRISVAFFIFQKYVASRPCLSSSALASFKYSVLVSASFELPAPTPYPPEKWGLLC